MRLQTPALVGVVALIVAIVPYISDANSIVSFGKTLLPIGCFAVEAIKGTVPVACKNLVTVPSGGASPAADRAPGPPMSVGPFFVQPAR